MPNMAQKLENKCPLIDCLVILSLQKETVPEKQTKHTNKQKTGNIKTYS